MNGASSLENKFGGLFGSKFGSSGAPPPPPISTGGAMYGPYNSPSYIGGSPIIGGSSLMGGNPLSGFMTPELEHKTSVILPLAGAALLGKFSIGEKNSKLNLKSLRNCCLRSSLRSRTRCRRPLDRKAP